MRFVRDGHDAEEVRRRLAGTSIKVVPFGPADAALSASLWPRTRRLGLSLDDRACLALALARNATALTAKGDWKRLRGGPKVEVIR